MKKSSLAIAGVLSIGVGLALALGVWLGAGPGKGIEVAAAAPVALGDAIAGKTAFRPCASCHQVGESARAGFGPQLNGILGRRAGSTSDYRYSTAMANSKIVWSDVTLTAFIKDAERYVPGTKMRFSSFGYDDRKIADLLAYLRTFRAEN